MVSWQSTGQTGHITSVKAEKFKDRINYHLQLNFSDCEYNVTRLSRDMGMSRSQLFRKCKLMLRKSPVALIKQYRLEKSREFLKSGIYNVSEAAYLAGFNSLSYFSKSFKKNYGQMPSKWVA
jgi:AraC-like DNA-binding protein